MTDSLVAFQCPTHGHILHAPPHSRVECRCGQECTPEGYTLKEHQARYVAAVAAARRRRSVAAARAA